MKRTDDLKLYSKLYGINATVMINKINPEMILLLDNNLRMTPSQYEKKIPTKNRKKTQY
jgi:hypothetical protein